MITVPANRIRQFGVEFYQAVFSAADIDRLVRFEIAPSLDVTPSTTSSEAGAAAP